MVAHLLPNLLCALTIASSSSGVKGRCSTSGESWLHHRSRHDLPDRPGIDLLITVQFLGPRACTSLCSASSSSGLHGPLIRSISLLPVAMLAEFNHKNKIKKISKLKFMRGVLCGL
ncbi:hypothetical protein V8G54_036913 [Vigna mungo]|uniref:Secreted protein n=1 Tax=Vigna mungo TaxID=3915 RepID=A0AAQ3MI35_VIGMU